MVVIIRRRNSRKQIVEAIERRKQKKGFNAQKYAGILKLNEDPLAVQKALRDEWD